MFDYMRYFEKLQYDRTAQITLSGVIVFMLIFPVYFQIGGADSSGDAKSVQGEWLVEFEFTNVASGDETVFVSDGGTEELEFVIPQLEGETLYAIAFVLSYQETDEGGAWPDQCDDVTLELDPSALTGYVSYSEGFYISIECGFYDPVMSIMLKEFEIPDWQAVTNSSITTPSNMTLGEVEAMVAANGFGRGPVTVTVNVNTNTGSFPGPGPNPGPTSNNEDGEEVSIGWRAISYTHSITNTADFVDDES